MSKIGVIGTGYVGLVTGTCLSSLGHSVICIDNNVAKVSSLNEGIIPIFEPKLATLINESVSNGRLLFTTSLEFMLKESDFIFIAVGTPNNGDGGVDLCYIEQVAKELADNMDSYKVIITKSTVPVHTNKLIKNIIKTNYSGAFDVMSSPEFLKEGSAIDDFFNMERLIVGVEDLNNKKLIKSFLNLYEKIDCKKLVMGIESAELVKYASNAFLATKISFINRISDLCDISGANIDSVAAGMGTDSRIGAQFLKAGLGYGGSCFPKDTKALLKLFLDFDLDFKLLKGVISINENRVHDFIKQIECVLAPICTKKIAVLGVAFKAGTDDIRYSKSLEVIDYLKSLDVDIIVYDKYALNNFKKEYPQIKRTEAIEEAIKDVDGVIILTDSKDILNFGLKKIKKVNNSVTVFDWRNTFNLEEAKKLKLNYFSIGR